MLRARSVMAFKARDVRYDVNKEDEKEKDDDDDNGDGDGDGDYQSRMQNDDTITAEENTVSRRMPFSC